jgi:site-specific DNA recombinase
MTSTTLPTMRAGLYQRVSSEEQVEGYSLDAQDRAGRLYGEAHGWEIIQNYRDEGRSARTDDLTKRPAFQQLLADAEAGRFDVIIVHKLDRFSRNLRVTLETLERLQTWGVGFVSISEQMDFTTPIGKVVLATLAAFAQYYSDNLSTETKKGKAERKAQGLYNGLLPFGVKKNSAGIPVPDPATYPGLLLAFEAAGRGSSDRAVAVVLNERGYRTSGNRGHNLFSKDTVRPLLQNRFYLGELPDGNGGWLPGAHEPLLDDALFVAAKEARERRATNPLPVKSRARTYSLSGLLRCQHCGGTLHLHQDKGRARAYCYRARQGPKCAQRSTFLDVYETQILDYLSSFTLPDDLQNALHQVQTRSRDGMADVTEQRGRLERQLTNVRTLFELGDLSKEEYVQRREQLVRQRDGLRATDEWEGILAQAATFLSDLPAAWRAADNAQRNALARMLFVQIRVNDDWVVAVEPQPSFAPFFSWDCQARRLSGGSDGDRSRVRTMQDGTVVVAVPPERRVVSTSGRVPYQRQRAKSLSCEDREVVRMAAAEGLSLRTLARKFGTSHETIRRVLA